MELISAIFGVIVDVISKFGQVFVDLFEYITDIFFVASDGGYTITPVGILTLCVFGIGLVWTGIRWLSRLIKLRG